MNLFQKTAIILMKLFQKNSDYMDLSNLIKGPLDSTSFHTFSSAVSEKQQLVIMSH
jgi:hypothetical protein